MTRSPSAIGARAPTEMLCSISTVRFCELSLMMNCSWVPVLLGCVRVTLAGGIRSRWFGGGENAASGCIHGECRSMYNNTVCMGEARSRSARRDCKVLIPDEGVPIFNCYAMAKAGKVLLVA